MPQLGRPELVVADVAWEGDKVAVTRPPVTGVWTEDVAVRLSERSLFALEGLQPGVMCPFDQFDDGAEIVRASGEADALYDALRHWSEACDRVARVRLSYDCGGGFGGVAEKVAEYAWDEHAKAIVISMPLEESDRTTSDANLAKCFTRVQSTVAAVLSGRDVDPTDLAMTSVREVMTAAVAALYSVDSPETAVRGRAHVCWAVAAASVSLSAPLLASSELPMERHEVWSSCEAAEVYEFGQSKHIGKRLKEMLAAGLDENTANDIALLRERYL